MTLIVELFLNKALDVIYLLLNIYHYIIMLSLVFCQEDINYAIGFWVELGQWLMVESRPNRGARERSCGSQT